MNPNTQIDRTRGDRIRVAYGSVPKESGTFTFYRNQRPALLTHNIDLRCVSVGAQQAGLWRDEFADEGCHLLAADETNCKRQAQVFAEWCEAEAIDIVIGINSCPILSALPHLPEKIRVVARCANAFDDGYRVTIACYERLAKIVAITPRLQTDLIASYGVEKERLTLIPNGIDESPYQSASKHQRGLDQELKLSFLGRLEHNQKGVLFLPEIVRSLRKMDTPFTLRIAGKGKHEGQLRKELKHEVQQGTVRFEGSIQSTEVPTFLGETDILLFPSQFEGCPNVLLEAMLAGAVPVAWHVRGITDYVIQDSITGELVELGHCGLFAEKISALADDRPRLQAMSTAARLDAQKRFTPSTCAPKYAEVFRSAMDTPAPSWTPKPWNLFEVHPVFVRPSLFRRIFWAVSRILNAFASKARIGTAS